MYKSYSLDSRRHLFLPFSLACGLVDFNPHYFAICYVISWKGFGLFFLRSVSPLHPPPEDEVLGTHYSFLFGSVTMVWVVFFPQIVLSLYF